MAANPEHVKPLVYTNTAVFIDVDSYFRSTRENFNASQPDVDVAALARGICQRNGLHCRRVYAYMLEPASAGAGKRKELIRRIQALAESSGAVLRLMTERSTPRLAVDEITGRPQRLVSVLDHTDVLAHFTADVIDELVAGDLDSFVFVTRESAVASLVPRLHALAARDDRHVRYFSAAAYNEAVSLTGPPALIHNTEWLYITREIYDAARLPAVST